jgi:hypothetical protein
VMQAHPVSNAGRPSSGAADLPARQQDLKVGAAVKVDFHLVGKDRIADMVVIGAN